jgi:DNA invertase Pin-like site-specific DNA recombinase
MEYVWSRDHIFVQAIDRLARNVSNLRRIVDNLKAKGVSITFISNDLTFTPDSNNPMSELAINMLASFSESERWLIKERQREGIAKAKKRGTCKGRPESIDRDKLKEMIEEGIKPTMIQKDLGLSKASFYRVKSEFM